MLCLVLGGTDADIAAAILAAKAPGVGLVGTTTSGGAKWTKVTETRIKVALTISTDASLFPSDGIQQIRDALAQFVAGLWEAGPGQFDLSGQGIGESVNTNQLLVPAQSVPGHVVTAVTVTDGSDTALPATTPLGTLYTLAASDVTISVS